jgi:hypothetical protein
MDNFWNIESKKGSENEKHREPEFDEELDMQTSNNHILSYEKQNQAKKGSIEI